MDDDDERLREADEDDGRVREDDGTDEGRLHEDDGRLREDDGKLTEDYGKMTEDYGRDPSHKRCYLRRFVAFAFPGWFAGCSFWAAVSGASGARARVRPHVSLLGWGPAGAQKGGIPGIIWGWGGQHAKPNQP